MRKKDITKRITKSRQDFLKKQGWFIRNMRINNWNNMIRKINKKQGKSICY
jgi:hypothetical protein